MRKQIENIKREMKIIPQNRFSRLETDRENISKFKNRA